MWEDPIVAEVHRVREKLAAEFQFDVHAIFADLRNRQAASGTRLIPQKTRTDLLVETDEVTPSEIAPVG